MAGGYIIDPATGQAGVQTASGGFLPLPMSPDQLSAAGLPGPPGLPPAPPAGPDMRVAGPGGGPMAQWGDRIPTLPAPTPQEQQANQADAIRAEMASAGVKPQGVSHETKPQQPSWMPTGQGVGKPQPVGVDPASLARGGSAAPQQSDATPGGSSDPAKEAALAAAAEYLKGGGGGGGPRKLGVTGETQKYTTFQNPGGDPAKVAAAQEALGASDKYGEELAKSLTLRQEQAYQAQQGEYAARAGQMAAQQQRFEQQQAMLQDYQAKRDAAMQEAAQLKTPQMEDYWESRGTMANIATALSITLGGALQGLRGGSNTGLEMSNQAIDRWISGQREQYQRAREKGNDLDNQYAKMVQRFGSENLAADHLREQAWTVRDGMLKSYAEKIGTPSALENYNQAMLQTEAQRAALQAQNSQGAAVEVEQKLSMQGGGGGKARTLAEAYRIAAETKKNADIINGEGNNPERPITGDTSDAIGGALDTIVAARGVKGRLKKLGVHEDDTDDPRAGAYDYVTKNIPGTETRRTGQDLDLDTEQLARGAQQFLGKSDNDANLAERQAKGLGGSGRERYQSADRLENKAARQIKMKVSSMTPDQRRSWMKSLPPDQYQIVNEVLSTDSRPAASAQEVR